MLTLCFANASQNEFKNHHHNLALSADAHIKIGINISRVLVQNTLDFQQEPYDCFRRCGMVIDPFGAKRRIEHVHDRAAERPKQVEVEVVMEKRQY